MARALICAALLLGTFATQAASQVRVDARLDKETYLQGEPVTVVVDILNTGDEAFAYSTCDGRVTLTVSGVERRVTPDILGCFSGIGSGGVAGCAISHPPMLAPGERTSFRYLLRDYDLAPGQYSLTAAGKAGVRWKYYPWSMATPNPAPPPQPKHKESDPVPGAAFERTFALRIAPATEDELKRAFAPLVAAADDPMRRYDASAAIVESAPPFLVPLIARFAAEQHVRTAAIESLGRISTDESRAALKALYESHRESWREYIVLTLARYGHAGDAGFFAAVLADATADHRSRRYAALGLGQVGGDQAALHLERLLPTAPPELRPAIATALGNTRSRLAVPVLIGMYGNNPARNEVCSGLKTLTHRIWCTGVADDPVASRRQWLRSWNETGSTAQIFGPDNCPKEFTPSAEDVRPLPVVENPRVASVPRVTSVQPQIALPNSEVAVSGYGLGLEDSSTVTVLFVRDRVEHLARISGSGRALNRDPNRGIQYMSVVVPEAVTPGNWQLVVDVEGRRSAPAAIAITTVEPTVLTSVSPARPHPSQIVTLTTSRPAQIGDQVDLVDGRGARWRIGTGVTPHEVSFKLPDEVADGEATVRVGRTRDGVDSFGAPLTFVITSGPLPLGGVALGMTPVAPGQWTDLLIDHLVEYELRRADRVEVEFTQSDVAVIGRPTGPDRVHVQVPTAMKPGLVSVRNRTWIEQAASEWSAPAEYRVLARRASPSINSIEAGPVRSLVWWSGDASIAFVSAKPGDALVLRGHFPVAGAGELRIQLRRAGRTLDLPAADVEGGVRVDVPRDAAAGDWRLLIGSTDGILPIRPITTVRVR